MSAPRDKPARMSRRRFLAESIRAACGAGVLGMGLVFFSRHASSRPAHTLRPPGALAEEAFLGACVRCGLCVRDCPYDTLRLSRPGDVVTNGTPYFIAREVACEMCEDIPCVLACPTGALDKSLTDIDDARMGLAVLVDQENCLNYLGLRCDVCYRVCPLIDKAITLEARHNPRTGRHTLFIPIVHAQACTGCGKCEQSCVLEQAAIKVLPPQLARGKPGQHYRLGWEEKRKLGGSLVAPDKPHQYNLPPGVQYDQQGTGLVHEKGTIQTPFAESPLETLNQQQEAAQ